MNKGNLYIKKIVLGLLSTNCYIVACKKTKEALIIDPAIDSNVIINQLKDNNFKLKYIINSHGHWDHIGGNRLLKEKFSATLLIHSFDANMLTNPKNNLSLFSGNPVQSPPADAFLEDGHHFKVGYLDFLVMHTPGHSPGSISIKINQKVFTGDTLFANGIGRTDLPGGSMSEIKQSIKEKLAGLSSGCEIFPGHGPVSTIGEEIKNNPWF